MRSKLAFIYLAVSIFGFAVACAAEPAVVEKEVEVIKEVIVEVPVEVVKEVIVELPVEVTRVAEAGVAQTIDEPPHTLPDPELEVVPDPFSMKTHHGPDVYIKTLESEHFDKPFRLYINLPANYERFADTKSYPVLYTIEGNWGYRGVSWMAHNLVNRGIMTPMILVSVGYDTEIPQEISQTMVDNFGPKSVFVPNSPAGGNAEKMLRAFDDEIVSYMDSTFSVDKSEQYFQGWELGGTFGLYAMFNSQTPFKGYALSIPLLKQQFATGEALIDPQELASTRSDLPTNLYISASSANVGQVERILAFQEEMEAFGFENFKMKVEVFENESRGPMYYIGMYQGMENVFQADSW